MRWNRLLVTVLGRLNHARWRPIHIHELLHVSMHVNQHHLVYIRVHPHLSRGSILWKHPHLLKLLRSVHHHQLRWWVSHHVLRNHLIIGPLLFFCFYIRLLNYFLLKEGIILLKYQVDGRLLRSFNAVHLLNDVPRGVSQLLEAVVKTRLD